jgi:diguanylate cyclase (GGDEF)-like protein
VRRGAPYARGDGAAPLQPCSICGDLPGVSRCTPSLVGGEVIGSLLVTRGKPLGQRRVETISGAVNQAAGAREPAQPRDRRAPRRDRRPHRAAQRALDARGAGAEVAQAGRSVQPLGAVALGLDHFKTLNDRHGHQAGDEALAAVGAALAATVRASDFAGRWGGEEFLVLLPDTGLEGATLLAEKLRAAVSTIDVPGVPGRITASAGVAVLPDHAADAEELLRAADRALYAAKAAGRNRVARAGDSAEAATAGSR